MFTIKNFTRKLKYCYFPFLYKDNIRSLETLDLEKQNLIEKTKKYFTSNYEKANLNTDMLYLIYNERKNDLDYINKGIKNIL